MRHLDLTFIQDCIYQSRPSNQYVISEYDLASLIQIDVKRLHVKILGATDRLNELHEMSDYEFENLKRKRKNHKNARKDQYCYVFTEEQIGIIHSLFAPTEKAYKIIPIVLLAFEDLVVPYEKQTKKIITQKRKAETKLFWTIAISVFAIYFITCALFHSYWGDDYPQKHFYIASAIGLVLPALSLYFPRHKLWGWCDNKLVDEEYSNFYKTLMDKS